MAGSNGPMPVSPAEVLLSRLQSIYPDPRTELNWADPWQLLVAVVLSAQCTDKQVNKVTPALFAAWPGPHDLASAGKEEVAGVIRSTGFYNNKAANLIASARIIVDRFMGKVPDDMDSLLVLPGVARKTANIVLSAAFGINAGIAVDTHVKRIARRLGLTASDNPLKIERDLMPLFPRNEWGALNHMLVLFGRQICKARKPLCPECLMQDVCPGHGVNVQPRS